MPLNIIVTEAVAKRIDIPRSIYALIQYLIPIAVSANQRRPYGHWRIAVYLYTAAQIYIDLVQPRLKKLATSIVSNICTSRFSASSKYTVTSALTSTVQTGQSTQLSQTYTTHTAHEYINLTADYRVIILFIIIVLSPAPCLTLHACLTSNCLDAVNTLFVFRLCSMLVSSAPGVGVCMC
jgi:hypothetical protein